ncbi:hypothetical protein FACS1894202_12630 [Clostridia bacterium]|nr:hypothetical protein FACS1894202_12630 [Clostridia bacterium]
MLDKNSNVRLSAYMYAATSFDRGDNIFSSFIPLVESILLMQPHKQSIQLNSIIAQLNETYEVKVDSATILHLLDIMKQQGKVSFLHKKAVISYSEQQIRLQETTKNEQDLSELFDAFVEFHNRGNENSISMVQAKEIVCTFIFEHSHELEKLTNPNVVGDRDDDSSYKFLVDFVNHIKSDNQKMYNTILRLYKGSVQASLLNFNNSDIEEIQSEKIPFANVILDSNFVMRLLDIQDELDGRIARETYESLKALGTKFYVLECTIAEIKSVIERFNADIAPYTQRLNEYYSHTKIRLSGLVEAMQRGKTRTYFLELSTGNKLKTILEDEFGIIVDDHPDTFTEKDVSELFLKKNKNPNSTYGRKQAIHDLTVISYCLRKRDSDGTVGFFGTKWWVLTNDIKLAHWNQEGSSDIHECISETQLSDLLWISRKRNGEVGFINMISVFASYESLDYNEIISFIIKMDVYKETSADALNTLPILYANSLITTEDIRKVLYEDTEVDSIIRDKTEKAKDDIEATKQKHNDDMSEAKSKLLEEQVNNKKKLEQLAATNQLLERRLMLQEGAHSAEIRINALKEKLVRLKGLKKTFKSGSNIEKLSVVVIAIGLFSLFIVNNWTPLLCVFELIRLEKLPDWLLNALFAALLSYLIAIGNKRFIIPSERILLKTKRIAFEVDDLLLEHKKEPFIDTIIAKEKEINEEISEQQKKLGQLRSELNTKQTKEMTTWPN